MDLGIFQRAIDVRRGEHVTVEGNCETIGRKVVETDQAQGGAHRCGERIPEIDRHLGGRAVIAQADGQRGLEILGKIALAVRIPAAALRGVETRFYPDRGEAADLGIRQLLGCGTGLGPDLGGESRRTGGPVEGPNGVGALRPEILEYSPQEFDRLDLIPVGRMPAVEAR